MREKGKTNMKLGKKASEIFLQKEETSLDS